MDAPDSAKPFPLIGLLTMSALIFTAVTSEFLPTGLLPDIASDLRVTESQVGLLITVFAGAVVLATAPLAVLTRNHSRKGIVVVVLLVFVFANVLAGFAPSYEVLLIARVIGGMAHGLFWAVAGAYAAHMVPPHQLGRAIAITGSGGTAAFVLGVPLGTALGHALGWRIAFLVIAGIVLALTLVTVRLLPAVRHGEVLATGEISLPLRHDRTIPAVLLVSAIVLTVALGHNIFYTYIAPYLIGAVGIAPGGVAGVLFLYGGAGAVGLIVAGVVSDRVPRAGLIGAIGLIAAILVALAVGSGLPWFAIASVAIWGMAFGGVPSMMQTRMMRSASLRMRDFAAAAFTTSFNVAIGLGAFVGGILFDQVGVLVLPWVDLGLTMLAIAIVIFGDRWLAARAAAVG